MSEAKQKRIALVGSHHLSSLQALAKLADNKTLKFLLFGDAQKTLHLARSLNIATEHLEIQESDDETTLCSLAAQAAAEGHVDILMKGDVGSAALLKAVLNKHYNLVKEGSLLSHVAQMELPFYHKKLYLTDSAVAIAPTVSEKLKIIANALNLLASLGISKAKVALIAPVEKVNPRIQSTVDAQTIKELASQTDLFGDALVDGPFALDVALLQEAALVKHIDSPVAADADLLVMDNLDAANALYKAWTMVAHVKSSALVIGAQLPIVLTSRSDEYTTRVASLELALKASE